MKMKVGILGCGNIGYTIGRALIDQHCPGKELFAVCDSSKNSKVDDLLGLSTAKFVSDPEDLLSMGLDTIVEAANPDVGALYGKRILDAGINLILLSSGALLKNDFYTELEERSNHTRAKLIVPSGAIGGMSVLKAAKVNNGLNEVTITTTKNPRSLMGAPFFKENQMELEKIEKKTLIFDGSASEAIVGFPKNVNIAVTVSLAGLGPEKTRIKIIADPAATLTTHELLAKGSFGTMELKLENEVSPDNPGSSYLASLSAISALKDFDNQISIGF